MLFLTVVGGNPDLVENCRSPGLKVGMGLIPILEDNSLQQIVPTLLNSSWRAYSAKHAHSKRYAYEISQV